MNSAENSIDMFSAHCFELTKFKGFRVISNDLYKKLNLSPDQIKAFNDHKISLQAVSQLYKK